jgi:DNA polymerase-3 subunit alpha
MRSGEKEVLGYYVHSHPLAEHKDLLDSLCSHGTTGLAGVKAKGEVVIGGLVSALKLSNTKQARPGSTHTRYAMFDLEDMDGLVRTICWPEDYARLGEAIQPDAVIVVAGSIDRRAGSEETNLVVNEIVPIAEARRLPARSVTVRVAEGTHDVGVLDRLAELVGRHPGAVPLRLVIDLTDGSRVLLEADRHQVAWSPELHAAVAELLGPGSVRAAMAIGGRGRRDGPGGSRGDGPRRGQGRSPAGVA